MPQDNIEFNSERPEKLSPWHRYEAEKKALKARKLSPSEYEKAIKTIAARLGI